MNKEYVYLVFYQHRNLPFLCNNTPFEYVCKNKIEYLYQYEEMRRKIVKELKSENLVITGVTFLREVSY